MKKSNLNCVPERGWAKRILSVVLSMVLLVGVAFAQQKSISGSVTDESGAPVPGVTVMVKGTAIGTVTDFDGKYTLSIPADAQTLSFSYIGMLGQDLPISGQSTINASMKADMVSVDEVVVVGYGTRLKQELTGAVSSVDNKTLEKSSAVSVASRLQGQIAGVTITESHTPGAEPTVRIRGIGTIGSSGPLYVIDGVPVGPGNNINPNDVESISVLKDAASAAIYGAAGANGVILITTKRGKENEKPRVTFTAKAGVNKPVNQYDLLNTQEFAEATWLKANNLGNPYSATNKHPQYGGGATPVIPDYILPAGAKEGDPATNPGLYNYPGYVIFKANKQGTNYYDEIYQTGAFQEYDVQVAGGGKGSTYAISANYLDEQGTLINTGIKRYTFRANADAKVTNWLKIGESVQVSLNQQYGNFDNNSEGNPLSMAYRMQPIMPVYDISGVNFAGSKAPSMGNQDNPVAMLTRAKNNGGNYVRILGNIYGEANLMKGLTFKSLFGYNYGQWNGKTYIIPNFESSEANKVNGLDVNSNYSIFWNWTNTLNYTKTFAEVHKVNLVVGTEAISSHYEYIDASRRQYFSQDPDYMQLSSGEMNQTNGGNASEWTRFSMFGRLNYDLMGKYFLEGIVRRDGSSKFGSNTKYGVFPAASVAWAISEEGFMAGTKNWLDMLKLRFGWGQTGNDGIGEYQEYSTFQSNTYTGAYAIDGSNTNATAGFIPATRGNSNIAWESTTTTDFGFDASMFDRKFTVTFDVWKRLTSDMLYQLPIPQVSGNVTAPNVNIGEFQNTGYDLEIGYNNKAFDNKFSYSISATVSQYKNEVTKLSDDVNERNYVGSLRQLNYTAFEVGHSYPEFYGYEVEGIFQNAAEVAAHAPAFDTYNKPGHYMYKDQLTEDTNGDGTPDKADGVINDKDRTWIGNPHPDVTGGLNIDLAYGNFDLNMFFYGSFGNDMVNYVTRWTDYGMFNGGLSKDALYNTWGSPYLSDNASARLPMLDGADPSQYPSSRFVEDASYLRMKTLRLGYNLPTRLLQKAQIGSVRVYGQVSNLFTVTGYSGLDPELNSSGTFMGLDQGAWPTPRQFIFGITVGL